MKQNQLLMDNLFLGSIIFWFRNGTNVQYIHSFNITKVSLMYYTLKFSLICIFYEKNEINLIF